MMRGVLICAALLFAAAAQAQDLFEIQVYDYDTVPAGKWELETHLNNIARGKKDSDGSVQPDNGQFHLSFELTHGFTEDFELAVYLLQAYRPHAGVEYAGARFRPRWKAPERWKLPVDFSLSLEAGFPQPQYEAARETLEIRPILAKTLGEWRMAVNPVFSRVLNGPGANEGYEFEPGAKVSYVREKNPWSPGLEYYGGTGPLRENVPVRGQSHFLFPCLDYIGWKGLELNAGVGFGLTPASEKLIFKTIVGYQF